MPFIQQDLQDVQESKPVSEGEYDLRIQKADEKESKKGNRMIQVMIVIDDPDYPDASPLNHWLVDPDSAEDENTRRLHMLNIKRFCVAFDLPYDFEPDDLPGATARCFLDQEENKDDGQIYNRLRLPRLKE